MENSLVISDDHTRLSSHIGQTSFIMGARTNHVAIANSSPLVDADPAMIKAPIHQPAEKSSDSTNAPNINPAATSSSPKIITLENHVYASMLTRYSMKLR
jgi:hypothetical protein